MTRAPFRIDKLRIKDFRGIEELELEFTSDDERGGLAVLAGDNGCGKTSVLEGLVLAFGLYELAQPDSVAYREEIRFGATQFAIEAEASRLDNSASNRVGARFVALGTPDAVERGADTVRPNVEYYSARREPRLGRMSKPPHARESERVVDLKRKLVNTYRRPGRSDPRSPFARLQAFLAPFLGAEWELDVLARSNEVGDDDEVFIRRGELPVDVTSLAMARALAPTRRDIPLTVPIDRLSSGQLALFAFAAPLVFRDAPADVVLIDEPEQHMHPKWHRFILGALRELSPESQFIVATHSLDVLDSAMSYERHLLLKKDDPRRAAWEELRAAGNGA